MQITDLLARTGGLASIARELGMSETQASSGAAALLPAILGGFKKRAQSGRRYRARCFGGSAAAVARHACAQPTDVSRGNEVLSEIFGSKDVAAR
jgi:hypothetical protein